MAKLSVIIVNYNVKYFLEQVLLSARNASVGMDVEIFVVDNNSKDGSVEMVIRKFPEVEVIANSENVGFSKANNQAIKKARGEYILLLNPDTVVEEDTFRRCTEFMDSHPEAGGLGVKMLDGKGNFLPESKRAFPTPEVSFYKAFGFTRLFPRSKTFARYYLGHLDENQTHEVEVLAGAFMLLRKSVIDEIGSLDESYFMYGEDIDLSYRIIKGGYKNFYFPETRIIHYKGESTKKGSLNYVKMFYQAMIIFARKHFKGSKAGVLILLINMAIYFRAVISLFTNVVKKFHLLLLDSAILFGGIYGIQEYWATNIKSHAGYYPPEFVWYIVPLYIMIWAGIAYFSGGYDKPYRISKSIRGILIGTLVISAIYGFLDEEYRFSRAIIVLGAAWAVLWVIISRLLIHFLKHGNLNPESEGKKNMVIAGNLEEGRRVLSLLKQAGVDSRFVGFILPENPADTIYEEHCLGDISGLDDISKVFDVREIIFCSKDISSQEIIKWMTVIGNKMEYKIVPEESLSIIGSNSKDTAGDLYAIDVNFEIATPMSRRNKRLLDVLVSISVIALLPLLIFVVKQRLGLVKNIFRVIFNKYTWVGYVQNGSSPVSILPNIKSGILTPLDQLPQIAVNDPVLSRVNLLYAKDYSASKDINIIFKGIRNMGRPSATASKTMPPGQSASKIRKVKMSTGSGDGE